MVFRNVFRRKRASLRIQIASLFCLAFFPLSAAEQTRQQEFAIPYSSADNLYLDVDGAVFLSLGTDLDRASIVADAEGRSYSLERIEHLGEGEAFSVEGDTIFLFENRHTHHMIWHFFHILEHLIGAWGAGAGDRAMEIKRVVLVGSGAPIPNWRGPNEINYHLLKALFPNASVLTWGELRSDFAGKLLHFPHAFLSDRGGEGRSKECARLNKMLGAARHKISQPLMEKFVEAVWSYSGAQEKKAFQVTYATRTPPRCLTPGLEKQLLAEIRKIPGVKLRVVDFAKMSFQEQIRCDRETDFLLSVHGNGLSHALFIKPKGTAVELFPVGMQVISYLFFCDLRGLSYFGIHQDRGLVPNKVAYEDGEFGDVNKGVTKLDIPLVIRLIKKQMAARHS